MAQQDELVNFVERALGSGQTPEAISGALTAAGWAGRDVENALGAWVVVAPGLPPVPRPRAYVSAREALVYGLLFLLLGCICFHIVLMGFALIDRALETKDWFDPGSIRWSAATLIPTVPLFLWLNRRIALDTASDPGKRRSLVRKWFASVTLLIASLSLLGDLVTVLYALLNGDVTAAFLTKAALVAVLAGLVFAYYRDELDDR